MNDAFSKSDSLKITSLAKRIVHVNRLNIVFPGSSWTVNESLKDTQDDFRVFVSSFPQILHQKP